MKNDDVRHEVVLALIDVIDCCSVLETELTHGKINVLKIIDAIEECIAGLNEARKLLEGLSEKTGSTPAAPIKPRRRPGHFIKKEFEHEKYL